MDRNNVMITFLNIGISILNLLIIVFGLFFAIYRFDLHREKYTSLQIVH